MTIERIVSEMTYTETVVIRYSQQELIRMSRRKMLAFQFLNRLLDVLCEPAQKQLTP